MCHWLYSHEKPRRLTRDRNERSFFDLLLVSICFYKYHACSYFLLCSVHKLPILNKQDEVSLQCSQCFKTRCEFFGVTGVPAFQISVTGSAHSQVEMRRQAGSSSSSSSPHMPEVEAAARERGVGAQGNSAMVRLHGNMC